MKEQKRQLSKDKENITRGERERREKQKNVERKTKITSSDKGTKPRA